MKILSSAQVQNTNNYKKASFGQGEIKQQQENITELSNVAQVTNVKVPISYNHIQDIKLSNNLTAKYYKLANGQKVVIVPKKGETVVKSYVNTGSFNEPDNVRGISHYIEHNLFNGSEALGDKVFFEEVDKLGGETNASTAFATTDYYISSQLLEDTDLEEEIKLHAGMLQSPKFLEEKLKKEKKIVNSEINMYSSDNENLGYTQTIKNLFNIKSSSLDLVAGTTDNIDALTREDVVNYFDKNYYPANTVTVITGDVDPDKTMQLVSKYFNSTKMPQGNRQFEKMTPIDHPVRQDIISKKSESKATSVFLGFAGPENNNVKDSIYMEAVARLFGGLLNSRIAEIEAEFALVSISKEKLSSNPNEKSLYIIESKVPDSNCEKFLQKLYKAVEELSEKPVTDVEFTAIKNQMKKSRRKAWESSQSLNFQIGNAFLTNQPDYLTKSDEIIDNMTPQDIVNAAKKYLDVNKSALTLVHPSYTNEKQIKENYEKSKNNVSFTGHIDKTPLDLSKLEKYKASNNTEILFNNNDSQNVHLTFDISNRQWTPKQAAVVAILADMASHADTKTKTLNQILQAEDINGVDLVYDFDSKGVLFSMEVPVENVDNALALTKEDLFDLKFSQKKFKSTVDRLKNRYSNKEASATDAFDKEMFKNTQYQFTTEDKLKSLDTITLDDIKNFYNEILNNSEASVVVSGDFNKHPEIKQKVFDFVNSFPQMLPATTSLENIYSPVDKSKVFTVPTKRNQADIIMGYKYKVNANMKDDICLSLMNTILGGSTNSRLFKDLRETRHLAYSVHSSVEQAQDIGLCKLAIGTTTENMETGEQTLDNIQKSIVGFQENIDKLKTQKVTEEELNSAKKALKTDILNAMDSAIAQDSVILSNNSSPYGENYVNEKFKMIDNITSDDIYNTANYVFSSKPIYSIAATQKSLDANKQFLDDLVK